MVYWSFLYTHGRLDEAEQVLDDLRMRVGEHNPHVLRMKSRLSAFMGRLDEIISMAQEMSQVMYQQHNYLSATILFTNYLYHTHLSKTDQPDKVDAIVEELVRLENEVNDKKGFGLMPKGYSASGFYQYTRGNWMDARRNLVDYVIGELEPDPLINLVCCRDAGGNIRYRAVKCSFGKISAYSAVGPPRHRRPFSLGCMRFAHKPIYFMVNWNKLNHGWKRQTRIR